MATEKIINTRIQLKYDTLANWNANSSLILKKGEVGICAVPTGSSHLQTTPPAIMFKVGDGKTTFGSLPWASALAADVYAWAKKSVPDVKDFGDIIAAARDGLISADSVVKTLNDFKGDIKIEGSSDGYIGVSSAENTISLSLNFADEERDALASGITANKVKTYDGYDAKITAAKSAAEAAQTTANGKYTLPTAGIPKADLSDEVTNSLAKADSALQAHQTIETGSTNGTIAVAGTDVAVKGLGSAAYTSASAYDSAGAAAAVLGTSMDSSDKKTVYGVANLIGQVKGSAASSADEKSVYGLSARLDGVDGKFMTIESDFSTYKTTNDVAVSKNASDISNLQTAVKAGITFKGKVTSLPATTDYDNGNLIIVGTKEYILYNDGTTKSWIELGDEGSHLTKTTADGYYVAKNTAITGATKAKITYDSKGLVTKGEDLTASDIPSLSASKITSGTFADARIASAATWNAKQNALSTDQLAATNSGITADKVTAYDAYATNKQDKLTTAQANAVNSGITSTKVKTYDGYASKISALEGKAGLDKVGTVTSVSAGTGLKITGTASVNPTVEIDDDVVFVFNCGSATELVD